MLAGTDLQKVRSVGTWQCGRTEVALVETARLRDLRVHTQPGEFEVQISRHATGWKRMSGIEPTDRIPAAGLLRRQCEREDRQA